MPQEPQLRELVQEAGAQIRWSNLLLGFCGWFTVCLGLWLVLFVLDGWLNLPAGLRLPLALGGGLLTLGGILKRVILPAIIPPSLERTAIQLEDQYHIPDNLLINAIQFQTQSLKSGEQVFANRTLDSAHSLTGRVRLPDLWNWSQLKIWLPATAAILVLWLLYILLFPRQFTTASARYIKPLADVPPATSVILKLTPGGDITLPEGENLQVFLEIAGPGARSLRQNPVLVWEEKAAFIPPLMSSGEHVPMPNSEGATQTFAHTFARIQTPFAFRVFAGGNYTRSIQVKIRPVPRVRESSFRLIPPAYTGLKPQNLPGPPAAVAGLPGSGLEVRFATDISIPGALWSMPGSSIPFARENTQWRAALVLSNAGLYQVVSAGSATEKPVAIAQGEIRLLNDHPPEIELVTDDRNRLVHYGEKLKFELLARDDYGVQAIEVAITPADQESSGVLVKRWTYLGPPGNPGPFKETFLLEVDPRSFLAGKTYLLEALASDFRPGATAAKSRPVLLRVQSPEDQSLPEEDPLAAGFAGLKKTAEAQEKANRLTTNLKTYLAEVLQKNQMAQQTAEMRIQQQTASYAGHQAIAAFKKHTEGKPYLDALVPLINRDMGKILELIPLVEGRSEKEIHGQLMPLEGRQSQVLAALLNLLGRLASEHQKPPGAPETGPETASPPIAAAAEKARELMNQLKDFLLKEEKILERSRTLLDRSPQDLTTAEEELLGELAKEEAQWAKYFEEKLSDFSKLPQQDFGDSSLARELNSVFQDLQLAEKALEAKKVELAVPHEQSGLENARELMNNLERWLPDTPDRVKWTMEDPLSPADVALAELPVELEDIVGDLIDKESEMTQDVEDATSSWMDSPDKGAGWDAMDGPISSMSAKGVTGNLLPNQQEVGGRSGEGRNGRSHGQMVADNAEGKGGRETPTRLTPSPFEPGSVKDSAKQDSGGATGGGKLSGAGEEGLRGPSSSAASQKLPRLGERQAKIRQEAEALALKLRRYHVPTGDLEVSVNSMYRLEQAARKNDGLTVRRAFSRAMDALGEAQNVVHTEAGLKREQNHLPAAQRNEIRLGVQDGIPRGYEEITSEYFRALAEGRK